MTGRNDVNWQETLVPASIDLHGVIAALDRGGLQIVMVVDDSRRLLGTVTDGDVRRALLRGQTLDVAAEGVMVRTPMVVGPEIGRDLVLSLMRMNKLRQLPILDGDRRVIGLHVWDNVVVAPARDNSVVLMAGGFGKRMMPHTENRPKPMLEVAGKPLLEHAIERAAADGFSRFVISVHYLPDVIIRHFGDGARWDVEISYLHETTPLGTAGALSLLDRAPEEPLVIANGDVLSGARFSDMLDFHIGFNAVATMAVREHEYHNPFGVVQTDGMVITGFEEKPVWRTRINAGIYVLNPEALEVLVRDEPCNMPTLFDRVRARGGLTIAYPMHETWMDVGNPQDLLVANKIASEP